MNDIKGRNGGDWKSRIIEKRARGSQTSGKSKGIVASAIQRHMCKRNRSWKHQDYGRVMASLGARGKKS